MCRGTPPPPPGEIQASSAGKNGNLGVTKPRLQWALFTRRPYCPERLKKLCLTTFDLAMKNLGAKL